MNKKINKFLALVFSLSMSFSLLAFNLDSNDDGIVDESGTELNIITNSFFSNNIEGWYLSGLYPYLLKNRAEVDDLMVGTRNDSRGGSGYISQEVNLFDLGFSDEVALAEALEANALQVRYGGWSAGDSAGITLVFKDNDGEVIGAPSIISNASTDRYVWMKRELISLIPEGTRSILYRVDLSGSDAVSSRFDDAFLFIERANDSDNDDVLDVYDIDNDNDGVIDIEFTERNFLLNNDFLTRQTHWTFSSLYPYLLKNRAEVDDLMVGTRNDSRGGSGYISQEVNLFDLGFSDEVALAEALEANAMQVRYGGWSAGDSAGITLVFKDNDGEVIGAPSIISNASTDRYVWMKRELISLIPEGTRSILYRVDLSGSDAVSSRFDDAFLFIERANDSDNDDVLDVYDIDNDNDGVIDIEFTERNFLLNNDFLTRQTHWTFSSLYPYLLKNRAEIDDLMVGTRNDSRGGSGYISQEVNLFDLGFSDEVALAEALEANAMQVRYGGWSAGDSAGITLVFKDNDGEVIGAPSIISNASTDRYVWMKRELTSLIPEGTRSILYRVDLSGSDAVSSRFDDAFLFIYDLRDLDSDGLSNSEEYRLGTSYLDRDTDGDNLTDGVDVYPLVSIGNLLDTDNDGAPNTCDESCVALGLAADTDDDNDGVLDVDDAFPLDPTRTAKVKNDLDGDGNSDLLWRSDAKGWNFLWAMDGVQTEFASPINVVQDDGWLMAGQGDYDDDGKSDIFWRNTITGQNFIYLMDGLNIKARKVLNYVDAPQWELAGSGDFNGDGKGDVLWRRVDRGDTWFYMMDGLSIGTNQPSLWVTDLNYKISAIGDINGDGTDDVIWRHQVTGINYIWIMENGQIANRYTLNSINSDWTIAGTGDLDGDGTDDIILRNQVDGRNWVYLMEDGQIKTSQLMSTVADTNWQIANMGDYDGDGKTDILWRDESAGRNIIHLMDGLTIKDKGVLRPTDTSWVLAQ
ncbi:VCBS repeat-containing protein [Paraglaciecola sp. L3A3]|uniref:FG-GAP repeat domain-containing protein n=1 Tax=Paraglaciecola sp. L3A3 TaxID=2686358 RepID=UPI00131CE416|nr:VCBS repeat-containing protein [Paraglaciecola sp. L3A3]